MLKKIVFLVILLLVALTVWFKREELFSARPLRIPFFGPDSSSVLTSLLDKNGVKLTSAPIVIGSTIQASVSGILVDFSTSKDLASQVRALQLVLGSLKMEGKAVSEIDLRFNKVVIHYER